MSTALSLYEHEAALVEALDALDAAETDQERTALALRVQDYLLQAVEKRDRFAQFLAHLEALEGAAVAEMARLRARKDAISRQRERLKEFAARTIASQGTDSHGNYRKLEGRIHTLSVEQNPGAVVVKDAALIPVAYLHPPKPAPEQGPNKAAIASAIRAGFTVPGADLIPGSLRLVVK